MEELTPPPPTDSQYYLKTHPVSKDRLSLYAPLYLRLRGDGINSVVLTPASPKFLRWHHEPDQPIAEGSSSTDTGKQIAISWKNPDRSFGLVIPEPRKNYAWEDVQIVEGEADAGFAWEKIDVEGVVTDVLARRESDEEGAVRTQGEQKGYMGWMACHWVHGHPQLFWANGTLDKELPQFCEPVLVVREWLIPRE
jgi:hypothetical protein